METVTGAPTQDPIGPPTTVPPVDLDPDAPLDADAILAQYQISGAELYRHLICQCKPVANIRSHMIRHLPHDGHFLSRVA